MLLYRLSLLTRWTLSFSGLIWDYEQSIMLYVSLTHHTLLCLEILYGRLLRLLSCGFLYVPTFLYEIVQQVNYYLWRFWEPSTRRTVLMFNNFHVGEFFEPNAPQPERRWTAGGQTFDRCVLCIVQGNLYFAFITK